MAHSQLCCPFFLLCSLLILPSVLLQDPGKPGGISPIPVTDQGVQEAAAFAVEQYNQRIDSKYYYKQLLIVKAESQVVEGVIYYLAVEVGKTACERRSGPMPFSDIQKCEPLVGDQSEKLTCNFPVWSRPWLEDKQLLGMICF